jgi:hypothetical protein
MSLALLSSKSTAFSTVRPSCGVTRQSTRDATTIADFVSEIRDHSISRRELFSEAVTRSVSVATILITTTTSSKRALAAVVGTDLDSYLYKIVRVREATQQERRLIQTGKFKDIQRANVKLAVKFMVQNYRLADCVVGAAAYLKGGNTAQMKAIDVGQTAVQNLQTILEYFDSSDVENIKVRRANY